MDTAQAGILKNVRVLHDAVVYGKTTMEKIVDDKKADALLCKIRSAVKEDPDILLADFAAGSFQPNVLFRLVGEPDRDTKVTLALAFVEAQHASIVARIGAEADIKAKAAAISALEANEKIGHPLRWARPVIDQQPGDTLLLVQTAVLQGSYDPYVMFGLVRGSESASLIRRWRALVAVFDRAGVPPADRRWDKGFCRSVIERLEQSGNVGKEEEGPAFTPEMTLLERLRAKKEMAAASEPDIGWALTELKRWCGLVAPGDERVGANGPAPRVVPARVANVESPKSDAAAEPKAEEPPSEPESEFDRLGLTQVNGDD